jgi:hypothetical protein
MSRVIDLSLLIEDNMPAHKLFQRPVYTVHLTHESTKALDLGVPYASTCGIFPILARLPPRIWRRRKPNAERR